MSHNILAYNSISVYKAMIAVKDKKGDDPLDIDEFKIVVKRYENEPLLNHIYSLKH